MSRDERVVWLIRTVLELALSALMIWYMLPQHQRQAWLMSIAQRGRTWSQVVAARVGRTAIRYELAGDKDSAVAGYVLARRLMTGPYRAADRWYTDLRSD